jgi:hypothetical protein
MILLLALRCKKDKKYPLSPRIVVKILKPYSHLLLLAKTTKHSSGSHLPYFELSFAIYLSILLHPKYNPFHIYGTQ